MAYDTIVFNNPKTGQKRNAPVGKSWTTLFFGVWPALLRGHYKGAAKVFIFAMFTFGLSGFYFLYKYNGEYMAFLIQDGFVPAKTLSGLSLEQISTKSGIALELEKDLRSTTCNKAVT